MVDAANAGHQPTVPMHDKKRMKMAQNCIQKRVWMPNTRVEGSLICWTRRRVKGKKSHMMRRVVTVQAGPDVRVSGG